MTASEEGHGQAFACPLVVPDDSYASVPGRSAGTGSSCLLRLGGFALERCRPERLLDGGMDSVDLVVAGHLLDQLSAAVVVEDDEVPNKREEPFWGTGSLEHDLEFRGWSFTRFFALHGPPGLEPLLTSVEGSYAGQEAVGDYLHFVHREHGGEVNLVVLELLQGFPYVGVFVGGVLQFDVPQGKSVDEQHDVRPS